MKLLRNTLTGLSTLPILLACTPTFQTTEQLCQSNLPTRQAVQSYEVAANTENSEYKLYAEDFLNSFKNLRSKSVDASGNVVLSDLSADEIAVRDFIFEQVDRDLKYSFDDEGNVESANNPVDFMESLIAAIDSNIVVQTFVEAKEQMASAIAKDDGHCTYRNDQIEFIREDDNLNILDSFQASLDLSYIPSAFADVDYKIDQTVLISFDEDPESEEDDAVQFASIDRITPEDFKASGFSEATVRQIRTIKEEPPQGMSIDEDYQDTKIATFSYFELNQTCWEDPDERILGTCPEGSVTRDVEHHLCADGVDEDEDGFVNNEHDEADETNTVISYNYTIGDGSNDALTDIQRLRVEVDYPNNEIRVYTSKFSTAIYRALDDEGEIVLQGSENPTPTPEQLIYNPTNCETYSVSRDLLEIELAENEDSEVTGIPTTEYLDPGYEYIAQTDENGDQLLDEDDNVIYTAPTPLFTLQGTAIPERQ